MAKPLFEIEGFDQLQKLIKRLPDNVKRREVSKLLNAAATPTLKAARSLSPVRTGIGRKSLAKKRMTRARNPMVTISPRSRKSADGWYIRQFVLPGTKKQVSNPFLDKAYDQTKGGVSADAEKRVKNYIQKQINRLGSA